MPGSFRAGVSENDDARGRMIVIEQIHLFHLGCPNIPEGAEEVRRFAAVPDPLDAQVLSQTTLRCEGCGMYVHADIWPMQPVDPQIWDPA
jgi:hypothetical protein